MKPHSDVVWFKDIRLEDVGRVGGKNASLGELHSVVAAEGVRVPNGFALTAEVYRDALTSAGAWPKLHELLGGLDASDVKRLAHRAQAAREIPNNVIQVDAFAALFDGFSIGSNDLTQLTLGVDRDSEVVAFDFDERNPGMIEMLRLAVTGAKRNHRQVGICGEAPANYPEIARFLVQLGISSISVKPSSLLRMFKAVHAAEQEMLGRDRPGLAAGG